MKTTKKLTLNLDPQWGQVPNSWIVFWGAGHETLTVLMHTPNQIVRRTDVYEVLDAALQDVYKP